MSVFDKYKRKHQGETAVALAEIVAGTNAEGFTVGLSYVVIVQIMKKLHPGTDVTPNTLKHYTSVATECGERISKPTGLINLNPKFPDVRPVGRRDMQHYIKRWGRLRQDILRVQNEVGQLEHPKSEATARNWMRKLPAYREGIKAKKLFK